MKEHEDYISGKSHFWIHFWCGLVFGGAIGTWISRTIFDSTSVIVIGAGITAVVIAFCCGRWGDAAWERLIRFLPWNT